MVRTSDQGGVDYAIRRDSDGMYARLYEQAGMSGVEEWVEREDDAQTWETKDDLLEAAEMADLASAPDDDDDANMSLAELLASPYVPPTLNEGLSIAEIKWINEEDL